jgi:hypothetical protein
VKTDLNDLWCLRDRNETQFDHEDWDYRDRVMRALDYPPQYLASEWAPKDRGYFDPHGPFLESVGAYREDFDVVNVDRSWYGPDFEWPVFPYYHLRICNDIF